MIAFSPGAVRSVKETLNSQFVENCKGVIQRLTLQEHKMVWNRTTHLWCVPSSFSTPPLICPGAWALGLPSLASWGPDAPSTAVCAVHFPESPGGSHYSAGSEAHFLITEPGF